MGNALIKCTKPNQTKKKGSDIIHGSSSNIMFNVPAKWIFRKKSDEQKKNAPERLNCILQ